MSTTKKLAKVKSAGLSFQDRHILTLNIVVDYEDGCSQNVAAICLDKWDNGQKKRIGTIFGSEVIIRLLEEFSIDDLHELKGHVIWVHGEGEGFGFKPTGVQSLNVNGSKGAVIWKDILEETTEGEPQ